jgi:hypothetical protein
MNDEQFEQRLKSQPARKIPASWREEILAHAARGERPQLSPISNFKSQISNLLWPHPTAWAGVAAVWIGILFLRLAAGDISISAPRRVAEARPSGTTLLYQEKVLVELLSDPWSMPQVVPSDRPQKRPHSARRPVAILV